MRIISPSLMLCAFVACATSEAKTPKPMTVELSSVTLADNCPTPTVQPPPPGNFAKPPPVQQTKSESDTEPAPKAARGSCARPPCPSIGRSRACEQTSMQLVFSDGPSVGTPIKIKRVELLDDKGKLLQTLTASMPTQWDAAKGSYVAWDGELRGSTKASYRLTAPDWSKLGGRFNAQSRKFQLRVIVTVGNNGSERTVEKTSIIPAHIEPMVVT